MFSGSSNPTEPLGKLYHKTGSRKSKMAATKSEALVSQLVDKIGTQCHRLHLCFQVQQSKSKMVVNKPEVLISAPRPDSNANPKAIPMFSGLDIPIGSVSTLYNQVEETGSGNSKMAAYKKLKCIYLSSQTMCMQRDFNGETYVSKIGQHD